MGKLIYSMITSLDGYVSDPDGRFGWGGPEEESHEFINEHMRSIGTCLYGRQMYDTMVYWETAHTVPDQPPFILEWARIWQAADKVVYSTTLNEVASERTRIERTFDPGTVRKLKAEADLDIAVAGPHLAAHAIQAGLVDEYQLFVGPAIVGGGNPFFSGRCARHPGTAGRAAVRQRRDLPALRRQRHRVMVCRSPRTRAFST